MDMRAKTTRKIAVVPAIGPVWNVSISPGDAVQTNADNICAFSSQAMPCKGYQGKYLGEKELIEKGWVGDDISND